VEEEVEEVVEEEVEGGKEARKARKQGSTSTWREHQKMVAVRPAIRRCPSCVSLLHV
jgi:hypothetical protein